jgi:hypothetical protein
MKKKLLNLFLFFLFASYAYSVEDIFAVVHIQVNYSWANKLSLKLGEIHPQLSSGIKNSRLYSETMGVDIVHNIDNSTLYFFFPEQKELKGDFEGLPFHYIYLETDKTRCFYTIKDCLMNKKEDCPSGDIRSTRDVPHDCTLHPFIFEGETTSGKHFKAEILVANENSANPFPRCEGYFDPVPDDCSAQLSLNMTPYNVITPSNPWRIRISPKPLDFDFYGYNAEYEDISTNSIHGYPNFNDLLEYDNQTGEIIMIEEGVKFFMLREIPHIIGHIYGWYIAEEDGGKYAFSHDFKTSVGRCTVKNKQSIKQEKLERGDFIVLRCGEKGLYTSKATTTLEFKFKGVPSDCEAKVKLVYLDSREDIDLPFNFECRDYIKEFNNK